MNRYMAHTKTLDSVALELLLKGDDAGLKALAAKATRWVECPECGDAGNKEHNGSTTDPTHLCTACGYQFDATEA